MHTNKYRLRLALAVPATKRTLESYKQTPEKEADQLGTRRSPWPDIYYS